MKKFSEFKDKIVNKKYHQKTKNDIYDIIKDNISVNVKNKDNVDLITENVKVDIEGISELVEKINKYVRKKMAEEKVRTLESIKSAIATGTLSLERINEEIEVCQCAETCYEPDEENIESKKDLLDVDTTPVDDFDEEVDEDDDTLIVDVDL